MNKRTMIGKVKLSSFNIYRYNIVIVALFSALLLFCSLSFFKQNFNKGIDVAGGIACEISCQNCDIKQIKNDISKKLKLKVISQEINSGYIIKLPSNNDKNYSNIVNDIKTIINKDNYKKQKVDIVRVDYVSPQMSSNFIKDAIDACIFAFICIGLYMILRFNIKFAMSAIISIIYDICMVICFVNIKQIEICLITLTAILTIIGYCINDKIVIFDKIRDNLKINNNDEPKKIVLDGIKLVIRRSLLTSITTIIVCTSLLFFGDRSIYELGITINYGIIIGTLSSIFLAQSILLLCKIEKNKKRIEKTPMFYAS